MSNTNKNLTNRDCISIKRCNCRPKVPLFGSFLSWQTNFNKRVVIKNDSSCTPIGKFKVPHSAIVFYWKLPRGWALGGSEKLLVYYFFNGGDKLLYRLRRVFPQLPTLVNETINYGFTGPIFQVEEARYRLFQLNHCLLQRFCCEDLAHNCCCQI